MRVRPVGSGGRPAGQGKATAGHLKDMSLLLPHPTKLHIEPSGTPSEGRVYQRTEVCLLGARTLCFFMGYQSRVKEGKGERPQLGRAWGWLRP